MKVFRRSIRLIGKPGVMTGEIADDFHHFAITLKHDGERVLSVSGEGLRTPWNTCMFAPRALAALQGLPLQEYAADFVRQSNSRAQCTHMYELVAVAASHALRNVAQVEYAAVAPYPIGETPVAVSLSRDGIPLLEWQIACPGADVDGNSTAAAVSGTMIVSPDPFSGQRLQKMLRWARSALSPDLFDAAYILRRAANLSSARMLDLDSGDGDIVEEMFDVKTGDCFAFQPENRAITLRNRGTTLDFTSGPGPLHGRDGT